MNRSVVSEDGQSLEESNRRGLRGEPRLVWTFFFLFFQILKAILLESCYVRGPWEPQ